MLPTGMTTNHPPPMASAVLRRHGTREHMGTRTRTQTHTGAPTHTHTDTYIHRHRHTDVHTHTSHTHRHTQRHTHTDTHTDTHRHTRTHTHTQTHNTDKLTGGLNQPFICGPSPRSPGFQLFAEIGESGEGHRGPQHLVTASRSGRRTGWPRSCCAG